MIELPRQYSRRSLRGYELQVGKSNINMVFDFTSPTVTSEMQDFRFLLNESLRLLEELIKEYSTPSQTPIIKK